MLSRRRLRTRICLDTGYAHATGYDEAWQAEFLRAHGDVVSHVHLTDTRQPDTDGHLPVGGMLDFEPIVRAMVETGWSGPCTRGVRAAARATVTRKRAFDGYC